MIAALGIVATMAWVYTLSGAAVTAPMGAVAMQHMAWSPAHALLMFAMWWIMMIAMMLPAAAPVALLFAAINRRKRDAAGAFVPTAVFLAGYLAMWGAFSLVATAAQWALDVSGLMSASMATDSERLGGAILMAAGIYQFSPAKTGCLRHCQSPVAFLSRHWHKGAAGALRMGMQHGAYCVGCCWFLMALLFFSGVMNVYWIAGLTLYVAMEKTVRLGHWLRATSGAALGAWGAAIVISTF